MAKSKKIKWVALGEGRDEREGKAEGLRTVIQLRRKRFFTGRSTKILPVVVVKHCGVLVAEVDCPHTDRDDMGAVKAWCEERVDQWLAQQEEADKQKALREQEGREALRLEGEKLAKREAAKVEALRLARESLNANSGDTRREGLMAMAVITALGEA